MFVDVTVVAVAVAVALNIVAATEQDVFLAPVARNTKQRAGGFVFGPFGFPVIPRRIHIAPENKRYRTLDDNYVTFQAGEGHSTTVPLLSFTTSNNYCS